MLSYFHLYRGLTIYVRLTTSIKLLSTINGYNDYYDNRERLSQQTFKYAEVFGIETKLRCPPWDGKRQIPHEFGNPVSRWELCKGSKVVKRSQRDIRVSILNVDAEKNRHL